MEVAFSTADVHPRDRFDFWHAACERIAVHDSSTPCRENFEAELSIGRIGCLDLFASRNSTIDVVCTSQQAAHADASDILMFYGLSGRVNLEQRDRRNSLAAGSLVCVDPRVAHGMHFLDQAATLIIKVPRRELEARLGSNLDIAARQITPSSPRDRLSLLFAAELQQLSGTLDDSSQDIIATQAIDLLALSLGHSTGREARIPASKSQLIWRIHQAVEARLQSDLTPERIAERVGVSVRHANKLLAEQGTSLMRLVQSKRLARCRRALQDPVQSHRSISDIAFAWGFSDLTHFSRSFKKAFGMSPSDLRRLTDSG